MSTIVKILVKIATGEGSLSALEFFDGRKRFWARCAGVKFLSSHALSY